MHTIKIQCPNCGIDLEYWTMKSHINCPQCQHNVEVKSCIDLDYLLNKGIVFAEEEWDEESGDYWFTYYEDEEYTKRIDDVDEFLQEYVSKLEDD